MNTRKIERYAKKFNKVLIMGLASTAIIGTLSGCHQAPKYANMNTGITHREVFQSRSLNNLVSNHFSDEIASDIQNSDGRTAIFSPAISDSKISKGNIKFDTKTGETSDISDEPYVYNSDGSDDMSDSDTKPFSFSDTKSDKEMHTDSEEPPVFYFLNKKKQKLYVVVPQSFGSLKAIEYKLSDENTHLFNGLTYDFKPIRLWHSLKHHKSGYHVPNHVANHNILKLTHTDNLKIQHHHKNKNSLNNVG